MSNDYELRNTLLVILLTAGIIFTVFELVLYERGYPLGAIPYVSKASNPDIFNVSLSCLRNSTLNDWINAQSPYSLVITPNSTYFQTFLDAVNKNCGTLTINVSVSR